MPPETVFNFWASRCLRFCSSGWYDHLRIGDDRQHIDKFGNFSHDFPKLLNEARIIPNEVPARRGYVRQCEALLAHAVPRAARSFLEASDRMESHGGRRPGEGDADTLVSDSDGGLRTAVEPTDARGRRLSPFLMHADFEMPDERQHAWQEYFAKVCHENQAPLRAQRYKVVLTTTIHRLNVALVVQGKLLLTKSYTV